MFTNLTTTKVLHNLPGTKCNCRRLPTGVFIIKCNCRRLQTHLFQTTGERRRSCATCREPNAIAGGYQHTCFKPTENGGGLAQLAGNKMQFQEVTSTIVLNFLTTAEVFFNSKQKNHRLIFCDLSGCSKSGDFAQRGTFF